MKKVNETPESGNNAVVEVVKEAKANAKKAAGKKAAEKKPAEKKAPRITLASKLDAIVAKGGEWPKLIEAANNASAELKTTTKFNVGVLRAHIAYRIKHNPDYLGKLKLTEKGVMAPKSKAKATANAAA